MGQQDSDGDSRRTFIKKGALAASAIALGTAATTGTASAQQDEQGLVFSYDYFPGAEFTVVARLEQTATVNVLEVDGELVDEISQPDDWNGHVIRYETRGGAAGVTTFLFLRDAVLSSGDTGSTSGDASMFSSELNLLSTSLSVAGNGNGNGETTDNNDSN
ncbi:calcium-binding protein [Natrinema halophilum]|uniref:calcium-binding protein n=1 Tax=Natrinema halophilum TaxID=1699371 RepID=UPI001F409F6F|nr:calcium-binding protein [Natrinema halophilum]UHQ96149.1 calcium-binding protein [Natrinema halophilum]